MSRNDPAGERPRLCFTRSLKSLPSLLVILALAAGRALAGPPYVTDDPEPVELHHWEVYLSSIYQHGPQGSSGTLPHIEVNNGLAPNLQLHIILPNAFSTVPGGPGVYGLG